MKPGFVDDEVEPSDSGDVVAEATDRESAAGASGVADELDSGGPMERLGVPVLIACCLLIPGLIQLLGGFAEAAQLEEWGFYFLFDQTGPLFFLWRDSPIGSQAMRPLTTFPHGVAWVIDSDGFGGYHIVHAVSLTMQSVGVYLLAREMRLGRQIARKLFLVTAKFPLFFL